MSTSSKAVLGLAYLREGVTRGCPTASGNTLHQLDITEVTKPTGIDLMFADSKLVQGIESLLSFLVHLVQLE